jgi:hypothetical protein
MLIPARLCTTVKNNLAQIIIIHLLKKLMLYFYNRLRLPCRMLLTFLDHTPSDTHTHHQTHTHTIRHTHTHTTHTHTTHTHHTHTHHQTHTHTTHTHTITHTPHTHTQNTNTPHTHTHHTHTTNTPSHTHTHTQTHPVGLLSTSDQLVVEPPAYTTHNHKRRTCMTQRDSKRRSQQSSVFRPTPSKSRPPGKAVFHLIHLIHLCFISLRRFL